MTIPRVSRYRGNIAGRRPTGPAPRVTEAGVGVAAWGTGPLHHRIRGAALCGSAFDPNPLVLETEYGAELIARALRPDRAVSAGLAGAVIDLLQAAQKRSIPAVMAALPN